MQAASVGPDRTLTEPDSLRLRRLIHQVINQHPGEQPRLHAFYERINEARIAPAEGIPRDVVTMNSVIRIAEAATGHTRTVRLVYNPKPHFDPLAISILSPLGIALLGRREGETVHCDDPEAPADYQIVGIDYQPEAAGRFDL